MGRSRPSPFPSTEAGVGRAAGKRVFEEFGLLCISAPNICPETSPGPSPAPMRPGPCVPTCPACAPLLLLLLGRARAPVRLQTPSFRSLAGGGRLPGVFPQMGAAGAHVGDCWSPGCFSHRHCGSGWGGCPPHPLQRHPPFTPGTRRRAGGPVASSGGGGCGLAGAQWPPRMLVGVGRLSRAPVGSTS